MFEQGIVIQVIYKTFGAMKLEELINFKEAFFGAILQTSKNSMKVLITMEPLIQYGLNI